jgi:hypothetical protein
MGRRRFSSEDGFGMTETTVAFGILVLAVGLMGMHLTRAYASVTFARQRHVATALANQVLEQVRALPFEQLDMGNADLAASVAGGEDGLAVTGTGDAAVYTFRGREIPRAAVTDVPPVVPHTDDSIPGPGASTYKRSVYVTIDPANPTARIVTVRVSWSPSSRTNAGEVQMETLVTGYHCVAQSGPRPCESYWYATADASDGSFDVSGTLLNVPLAKVTLNLADRSSTITTEQLNAVQTTASLPDAYSETLGAVTLGGAAGQVTADADDSLATPNGTYHNPGPLGPPLSRSLSLSGVGGAVGGVLSASINAGGSAGAVAAAATEAQSANLGSAFHTLDNDGLPHARATASRGGDLSAGLSLEVAGIPLGLVRLLTLPSAGSTGTTWVDRDPGASAATADDDSIVAHATRKITSGNAEILGFPVGALPGVGWAGYLLRLNDWSATATAAAGPGATAAGTTATQTGTLSYWNGTGYTVLNLASGVISSLPVSASVNIGVCSLGYSGILNAGGSETLVEHEDGNVALPIVKASAAVTAVSGTFLLDVQCLGIPAVSVEIDLSLGRTVAESHFSVPGA